MLLHSSVRCLALLLLFLELSRGVFLDHFKRKIFLFKWGFEQSCPYCNTSQFVHRSVKTKLCNCILYSSFWRKHRFTSLTALDYPRSFFSQPWLWVCAFEFLLTSPAVGVHVSLSPLFSIYVAEWGDCKLENVTAFLFLQESVLSSAFINTFGVSRSPNCWHLVGIAVVTTILHLKNLNQTFDYNFVTLVNINRVTFYFGSLTSLYFLFLLLAAQWRQDHSMYTLRTFCRRGDALFSLVLLF